MGVWFLIYAAGSVQAALLALSLWQRRAGSRPNQLLAPWMALLCFDLGMHAWSLSQPPLFAFKPMRLVALLPFLHGSLFYLYVRAVIHRPVWRLADLRHGLGFALALVATVDLFLLSAPDAQSAYRESRNSGVLGRHLFIEIGLYAYSLSYIAAALLTIRLHRHRLRATRSDSHPDVLRWLVVMAICQCLIWGVAIGAWLLPFDWLSYRLIYVAVAAWVLLVGYLSLLQSTDPPSAPDLRAVVERGRETSTQATEPAPLALPPDAAPALSLSIGSDAEDPRSEDVAERLQELMDKEALYLEPALSIAHLARRSGYPEYLVSAVINRRFGCPFWDYVNRYRVNEACRCLLDPADQRTALDIAYACGFTSKSTFNAAFKRLAGETPSSCRARAAAAESKPDAEEKSLPPAN